MLKKTNRYFNTSGPNRSHEHYTLNNASPFNIADNLEIPYFTGEETFELLHRHEEETGQLFDESKDF